MEDWVTLNKIYSCEKEAGRIAEIVKITESRLSSSTRGPQYDIETKIIKCDDGWQVKWRKIFVGFNSGCGGCNSCGGKAPVENREKATSSQKGKVIEFKPRT